MLVTDEERVPRCLTSSSSLPLGHAGSSLGIREFFLGEYGFPRNIFAINTYLAHRPMSSHPFVIDLVVYACTYSFLLFKVTVTSLLGTAKCHIQLRPIRVKAKPS